MFLKINFKNKIKFRTSYRWTWCKLIFSLLSWRCMEPVCKYKSSVHPHVHLQWGQRVCWRQPRRIGTELGFVLWLLNSSFGEILKGKKGWYLLCVLCMPETTSVIPNSHSNSARSAVSEDCITWIGPRASKQQKQLKSLSVWPQGPVSFHWTSSGQTTIHGQLQLTTFIFIPPVSQ